MFLLSLSREVDHGDGTYVRIFWGHPHGSAPRGRMALTALTVVTALMAPHMVQWHDGAPCGTMALTMLTKAMTLMTLPKVQWHWKLPTWHNGVVSTPNGNGIDNAPCGVTASMTPPMATASTKPPMAMTLMMLPV